ncbi:MAG TPA: ABC transporter substrate-binding protein [Candidatus Binatia bacterium]|nr:ABC transporter substrate-binding protein [Candidatus Binatia bacterium]
MFFKHGLGLAFGICIALIASGSADSQTRLIQAIPTQSFGFLPLFVAQERGFYQAEGLEVLAPVMKTSPSVAALISGEVHFAAADSAMRAALTGTPVKAVVFYYDRPTMLFVGRPEVRSVRDLQGKNIAILSYGSAVDFATRQLLRAHGLGDKDYTLVPMGPEPQRILGLAKGLVQASLLNPDGAAIAENQVEGLKLLASFGDLQKTPFSGFATSTRFISGNPETVKKFLRATVKAIVLTRDQPETAARVAEKVLGIDGKAALAAVRSIVGAISAKDPGGFSEAGMRAWIADNAKNAGRKVDEVKIAELADLRWLREVHQELSIRCDGGYECGK